MTYLICTREFLKIQDNELSIERGDIVECLENHDFYFKVQNSKGENGFVPKDVFSKVLFPVSNSKISNIDRLVSKIQQKWRNRNNRKSFFINF